MMHRFFAATGRFAVRFRWAIVVAWVTATVLAGLLLPSLASVVKESNTNALPAGSPSLSAARLAAPLQGPDQTPVLVVVARDSGAVSAADFTAIGRLTARLAKVADVQQVKDLGDSADRQQCQPAPGDTRRPPRPLPDGGCSARIPTTREAGTMCDAGSDGASLIAISRWHDRSYRLLACGREERLREGLAAFLRDYGHTPRSPGQKPKRQPQ